MTRIKGVVEQIEEVDEEGHEQPIIQKERSYIIRHINVGAGPYRYDLPNIPTGYRGYLKAISASCDFSPTNINDIWINRTDLITGEWWTIFVSYFGRGYEWIIGDVALEDFTTWFIMVDKSSALLTTSITINIYWIESPK